MTDEEGRYETKAVPELSAELAGGRVRAVRTVQPPSRLVLRPQNLHEKVGKRSYMRVQEGNFAARERADDGAVGGDALQHAHHVAADVLRPPPARSDPLFHRGAEVVLEVAGNALLVPRHPRVEHGVPPSQERGEHAERAQHVGEEVGVPGQKPVYGVVIFRRTQIAHERQRRAGAGKLFVGHSRRGEIEGLRPARPVRAARYRRDEIGPGEDRRVAVDDVHHVLRRRHTQTLEIETSPLGIGVGAVIFGVLALVVRPVEHPVLDRVERHVPVPAEIMLPQRLGRALCVNHVQKGARASARTAAPAVGIEVERQPVSAPPDRVHVVVVLREIVQQQPAPHAVRPVYVRYVPLVPGRTAGHERVDHERQRAARVGIRVDLLLAAVERVPVPRPETAPRHGEPRLVAVPAPHRLFHLDIIEIAFKPRAENVLPPFGIVERLFEHRLHRAAVHALALRRRFEPRLQRIEKRAAGRRRHRDEPAGRVGKAYGQPPVVAAKRRERTAFAPAENVFAAARQIGGHFELVAAGRRLYLVRHRYAVHQKGVAVRIGRRTRLPVGEHRLRPVVRPVPQMIFQYEIAHLFSSPTPPLPHGAASLSVRPVYGNARPEEIPVACVHYTTRRRVSQWQK